MIATPVTILLAEDDEGHAELARINLGRAGVINEVVHVQDGQEALDYVRREGSYVSRPCGALVVLLDVNMPVLDGVETLRQLKANPRTANVPVIILTTTDDPREVKRCYELGCNVYITKPVEYDAFCAAVQQLGVFLQFVSVPREAD